MTSILILQCILTWALISGMMVAGLHTALLTSPDFKKWFMEKMVPHLDPAALLWGAEMGRRFGPLVFGWMHTFFLPLIILFTPLIWRFLVMARIVNEPQRIPAVRADPVIPLSQTDSNKAWEQRLHVGIARVAYESMRLGNYDTFPMPWDHVSDDDKQMHTERVAMILLDAVAYRGALEDLEDKTKTPEEEGAVERLYDFLDITLACAHGLMDNGICAWPVTAKIDAVFEGDQKVAP